MSSSLHPGRPPTACLRCKQQKVRCSGNLPSCERCSRLSASCVYTPGPQLQGRRRVRHPQAPHINPLNILQSPDYLGIPKSLVSELVDIFFSHLYNSRLLLHKAKFQEDRQSESVRPHVLLAVCAIGGKFYGSERGSLPFGDFVPVWAERAGKLILNEVEEPHEDNIVTLLTLALFWYMEGAWRKFFIFKGIALQTANLLCLENNSQNGKTPLESELSRRRFWACYLTNCHISNSMFLFGKDRRARSLPLPWPEDDFEVGSSESSLVTFGSGLSNGGIHGELIRALTFWSTVDSLLKSPGSSCQSRISTIHRLDAEIRAWWSQIPPTLHLTPISIATFHRGDLTRLLLVQVAYHQCLCALHASIVPLFTWGCHPATLSSSQQLSAQLAYENAYAISQLLKMVLDQSPDTSGFSSFLGYAAYCSFAVQVPFKWCLDPSVRESAVTNTAVNLHVIQGVSRYWRYVSLLGTFAQYLTKVHSQHQLGLETEPKGLSLEKLRGFRISVSDARVSVLSMNGILWKDGGCAAQDDELVVLGMSEENNGRSSLQATEKHSSPHITAVEEDVRYSSEDASATALCDESFAPDPPAHGFTAENPPVLFHPFIHSSGTVDLLGDDLGFIDFGVMNACSFQAPSQEEDSTYDL